MGSSGKNVYRSFCSKCGSLLFGRPDAIPHIRTVSASSLDNPALFKPQMQVWVSEAPSWVCINNEIPSFEKNLS